MEITVNCSDLLQVSLLALFYPNLMKATQKDVKNHMLENARHYDFTYDAPEAVEGFEEYTTLYTDHLNYQQPPKTSKQLLESLYKYATLEELICESITSIPSPEIRNKMASKILLTGGVVFAKEYDDFVDILEDRLIHTITQVDKAVEKVDVIQTKEQEDSHFTWVGAAMVASVEGEGKERNIVKMDTEIKKVVPKEKKDDSGVDARSFL